MTVLVTGASGFIGRSIVHSLRVAGFSVRPASRDPFKLDHGGVALPAIDAPPGAFRELLDGVLHVVHCAALNTERKATDDEFHAVNSALTGAIARAAAACASGRFINISSIRAVAGAAFQGMIDHRTPENPQCGYGRSKRSGEIETLAAYRERRADAAVVRLPPVYGSGMKGNLATLMRMANTPFPLPVAGLGGTRSLVSLASVADAVAHLLAMSAPLEPIYVASDACAVSVPEIVAAFRRGQGRPIRLVTLPEKWLATLAAISGKRALWESLNVTQVCDPSLLVSTGWRAETDTLARLRELSQAGPSSALRRA